MKEKTNNKPIDKEFAVAGMTVAPGVVETVISLAAGEVAGVAGVGNAGPLDSIRAAFNAGKSVPTGGIKLSLDEENRVAVSITIQAYYGYRLAEVADGVRSAVADALKGQVGVECASVDIYVEALQSEE